MTNDHDFVGACPCGRPEWAGARPAPTRSLPRMTKSREILASYDKQVTAIFRTTTPITFCTSATPAHKIPNTNKPYALRRLSSGRLRIETKQIHKSWLCWVPNILWAEWYLARNREPSEALIA